MAQAALPSLHSNDGGTSLDEVHLQRVAQTEPDAVIHLNDTVMRARMGIEAQKYSHRFATGEPRCHAAPGTRMDSRRGAGEFDELSAHCGSLNAIVRPQQNTAQCRGIHR